MKIQKIVAISFAITAVFTATNCGMFHKNSGYEVTDTIAADSAVYDPNAANDAPAPYQNPPDKIWELKNTELSIQLDWQKRLIHGTAILDLQPYFYQQDSLILDAMYMNIQSVTLRNSGAQGSNSKKQLVFGYTDSQHLVITLPKTYLAKEKISIEVVYTANPENPNLKNSNAAGIAISEEKGGYFVNHDLSDPTIPRQFWTQGETHGSRCWFPTLDQPNQKHTQKITVTYPDTMLSISNGNKLSHTLNAEKREYTDVWTMTQPHSVYLTMLAVGNWAEVTDKYKDKVLHYYVEPRFKNDAKQIFGKTPKMIEFFSQYTGVEFPWNKFDQVVARKFVSGAMENTTAVVHSEGLQDKDNDMEDYISHELFHHWFGDYVTADNWGEITMNESFAKYSEYLWIEHEYGMEKAQRWLQKNNEGWEGNDEKNGLVNYNYHKADDQFDQVRYNKGAAILHMLRNYIGDEAFRLAIKDYLTTYAYGNATSAEWKRSIEKVTGKNMSAFFQAWYYKPATLNASWYIEKKIDSSINQNQFMIWVLSNNVYAEGEKFLPYKLDIEYGKMGQPVKRISKYIDNFPLEIALENNFVPDFINFDPQNTLVGSISPFGSSELISIENNNTDTIYTHKLLINNLLQKSNSYKKVKTLIDLIVGLKTDSNLNALSKSQINEIFKLGKETKDPVLIEYLVALIPLLKDNHPQGADTSVVPNLRTYCREICLKSNNNPEIIAKIIELGWNYEYKEGIEAFFTDTELVEFSKSENFELFDAILNYFQFQFYQNSENGDEETEVSTPKTMGTPYWVGYSEGQLSLNIPSKRKGMWANSLVEHYLYDKKDLSAAGRIIAVAEKSNIHIEDFSTIYHNLYSLLVNDYGQTENARVVLSNEIDRIIKNNDIEKIKLLKMITTENYEELKEANSMLESDRTFLVSLNKLHNFAIK